MFDDADHTTDLEPAPALLDGCSDLGRLRWALSLVGGFFVMQAKVGVVIGIPFGIWAVSQGYGPDELLTALTSATPLAYTLLILSELALLLIALFASTGFGPRKVGLRLEGLGRSLALLSPLAVVLALLVWSDPDVSFGAAIRSDLFAYVLVLCVLIGLVEELVFRGMLVGILGGNREPLGAAIVSAALFAVVHMVGLSWSGGALVAATIFGLFGIPFAFVYLRTGTIMGVAIVHAAWDLVVIGSTRTPSNSAADAVDWTLADLWLPFAVAAAYGAWFYLTMPERRPLPNPVRARRERSSVDWDELAEDEVLNPWVKQQLAKASSS